MRPSGSPGRCGSRPPDSHQGDGWCHPRWHHPSAVAIRLLGAVISDDRIRLESSAARPGAAVATTRGTTARCGRQRNRWSDGVRRQGLEPRTR
jgi:hypothetical protein